MVISNNTYFQGHVAVVTSTLEVQAVINKGSQSSFPSDKGRIHAPHCQSCQGLRLQMKIEHANLKKKRTLETMAAVP